MSIKRTQPAIERLNELFDLRDGVIYWKVRTSNRIKVGDAAGGVSNHGYLVVGVDGVVIVVHRIIFAMAHGRWPSDQLDHIDGNRINNLPSNLREACNAENQWNTKLRSTNTSGYKGVKLHRDSMKWHAEIHTHGRRVSLGYFKNKEDAAAAYATAAALHHGDFARLA